MKEKSVQILKEGTVHTIIECKTCHHLFDISDLIENSELDNKAKRLVAKARLRAFHWFHKISHRHCECCGCKK